MLDAFIHALTSLLTWQHMGFMAIGVLVGLVVGVLPGLGGIVGISLLLPFIYGMNPTSALAMLIGILAVIPTSDTFASILMGIPGSSASQATVLDGFPLAKQGEAARALSAAFSASMIGGLFGAISLTGFVVIARPLILSFSSAELFMLTLFGLSMVGVLSGSNLAKGIAACALGLGFGSIGAAPATGEYRMDFGTLYLSDGLPLVIVGLGLFAVPEIVDLLRSRETISSSGKLGSGWFQGVRDTVRNWWLTLRCSALGAMIGAIPGLGGSVVDWIAYGHVMQTSKDKSKFGKGEIRGVIAPESANNACAGGALIPTLLFGIPGSGSMAIFLAGMILLGLQPGPSLADPGRNLNITYTVVWSLAIANVLGTALCIVLAPWIARLTIIRYALIAPFMIMVISFASFQATRSYYDLLALLAVGILGIFLKRFGWPRPAFLIGFVLARQGERYLYQAVQFSGWDFLTRPLVITIAVIIVASVWLGLRNRPDAEGGGLNSEGSAESAQATVLWPQVIFTGFTLLLFLFVLQDAWSRSFLGGIFPLGIGITGLIASSLVLLPQLRGARGIGTGGTANFDAEVSRTEDAGPWRFMAWLVGFMALVGVIGFFAALVLFFIVFLRLIARATWLQTIILTAAAAIFMLVLADALNLLFPGGILQRYVNLPWPFR